MNNKYSLNYSKDEFNSFLSKVFLWMCMGLLLTTLVSFTTSYAFLHVPFVTNLFVTNRFFVYSILIFEVLIILSISFKLNSFSVNALKTLFIIYSVLNGLSFGLIFILYSSATIYQAFLTAAISFGVMSIYGFTTNKDLTKFGSFLIMGLFGIIILSVINMFIKSSGMELGLCIISVFMFLGITAYDIQKLKYIFNDYKSGNLDETLISKFIILSALTLYLDFINIFIDLLRIYSKRD